MQVAPPRPRRFAAVEPIVALSALGGTLLSLVELRFARPDLDGDESASNLAEMILRIPGVPPEDAREAAGARCPIRPEKPAPEEGRREAGRRCRARSVPVPSRPAAPRRR